MTYALPKRRPPARLALKLLFAIGAVVVVRASLATAQTTAPANPAVSAPSPTDVPAAEPTVPPLSPVDLFWRAGVFIWPLAACSVLAVALIIERFIALRRGRVLPSGFVAGLLQVFRDPREDRERALAYCEANDSPLARTIAAGLRRLPRGYAAAEKAIEDAGANEAMRLRQNMRFLYSIGSVATLLGLIGTIWGMIKAFEVASVKGPGHTSELSEGIYVAMVNTFAGLAVAIVVTIFYYYFIGRIEKLVSELNDAVNEFGREAGFDEEPTEAERVSDRM